MRCGFEARLRLSVKVFAALVVTGLALAAAGCSGGDDDEQTTQTTQKDRLPPKLGDTTIVAGTPRRASTLLRRVVLGMEKTTLRRIATRPLPESEETDEGPTVAVTFTSGPEPSVRRQWDEWIVAGAFSRRLDAAGLSAEVDAAGSGGSFVARPRVRGQPDPRPLSADEEAAIVKRIRTAASRAEAGVVRLEVHKPYGVAVALSVAPEDPASFLKKRLRALIQRLDAPRRRLEGIYLAVLDERGRLALEWGSWTRNPAGSYWVRRDLANCSPIKQSGPPGAEPPPACPV